MPYPSATRGGPVHANSAPIHRQRSITERMLPEFGRTRPQVDITVDEEPPNTGVASFTTLEQIKGTVSITASKDLPFDDIAIMLQGACKTYVEKVGTIAPVNPRAGAHHNFLRLQQPIDVANLPPDRIARAGVTIRLPFTFVVPERLLPQACTHPVEGCIVTEAHCCVPPSLGDPMMKRDGKSLINDMAPDNASISYSLRVTMVKNRLPGERPLHICDRIKKVRIVPATEEAPPVRVRPDEDDLVLSKSIMLRKRFLTGKSGRLTVEAEQPRPLFLPAPQRPLTAAACEESEQEERPMTRLTLRLRFEPRHKDELPPLLDTIKTRIKVLTFFSTRPMTTLQLCVRDFLYHAENGVDGSIFDLSSRNVQAAAWMQHAPSPSASPLADATNTPTLATNALPHYSARVLVPIELPRRDCAFVPTFYNCLVGRVYQLIVRLRVIPSAQGPLVEAAPREAIESLTDISPVPDGGLTTPSTPVSPTSFASPFAPRHPQPTASPTDGTSPVSPTNPTSPLNTPSPTLPTSPTSPKGGQSSAPFSQAKSVKNTTSRLRRKASSLLPTTRTNLVLKVPLQIASRANPDAAPLISAEEMQHMVRRIAEGTLPPEDIAPPEFRQVRRSRVWQGLQGARGSIFTMRGRHSLADGNQSWDAAQEYDGQEGDESAGIQHFENPSFGIGGEPIGPSVDELAESSETAGPEPNAYRTIRPRQPSATTAPPSTPGYVLASTPGHVSASVPEPASASARPPAYSALGG